MNNHISLEQVEAIAEQCRKMRSEAVSEAFASFFSSLGTGVVGFFSPGRKYNRSAINTLAGSPPKRSSLPGMNTGYNWRQITAD